jgi:hypothetical protein
MISKSAKNAKKRMFMHKSGQEVASKWPVK